MMFIPKFLYQEEFLKLILGTIIHHSLHDMNTNFHLWAIFFYFYFSIFFSIFFDFSSKHGLKILACECLFLGDHVIEDFWEE